MQSVVVLTILTKQTHMHIVFIFAQCMLGKHIVHNLAMQQIPAFYRPREDQIQIKLKLIILLSHLANSVLPVFLTGTTRTLSHSAVTTINSNKSVFRFAQA